MDARLLYKKPDGRSCLHEFRVSDRCQPQALIDLAQGLERPWWVRESIPALYIFDRDRTFLAPLCRLWAKITQIDPGASFSVTGVEERYIDLLGLEMHIADENQAEGGDVDCIVHWLFRGPEWARHLEQIRKEFLDSVRRYAELWAAKTGRPVTDAIIIEHQRLLRALGACLVVEQEPPDGKLKWVTVYQNPGEPDLVLQTYEVPDGNGRSYIVAHAALGYGSGRVH